jgi:hypothetical protein
MNYLLALNHDPPNLSLPPMPGTRHSFNWKTKINDLRAENIKVDGISDIGKDMTLEIVKCQRKYCPGDSIALSRQKSWHPNPQTNKRKEILEMFLKIKISENLIKA